MNAPLKKNHGNNAFVRAVLISLLGIHVPLAVFLTTVEMDLARKINAPKPAPVFVTLKQEQPPRIVDIAKPKNKKIPKKASALSQHNSSVPEETTAKPSKPKATPAVKQTATQPPAPTKPVKSAEKPKKNNSPVTKPEKATKPQQEPSETFASSRTLPTKPLLTEPPAGDIKDQLKNLRQEMHTKEKESYQKSFGGKSGFTMPDIKASVGGSGEDFQPSYKVGNRTFVNTLATPGIGYFVELKRRFRTAFNPIPILRPIYQQIAGRGKVSVILGVIVDGRGRLAEVIMIRSSGIPAYDQEARRTISQSAPFSAPASSMLDSSGRLNMAWTFTVYL